jgi:hypothetical protein
MLSKSHNDVLKTTNEDLLCISIPVSSKQHMEIYKTIEWPQIITYFR